MLCSVVSYGQPRVAIPDGYSTQNGGTTGGGNATPINVTTASAFKSAANNDNPTVIIVQGKLDVGDVTIGSNKTIIGADVNSGLYGGTIRVRKSNNIFQNLTIGPANGDAMEISGAKNIFITKCEFHDSSDELCSIVRESDFVTVSWCKFYFDNPHNHAFGGLIGNSDDRTSDKGKLHVTMHHNWYAVGVRGRMPRVRYGHVHIYNNYYNSVGNGYCIGTGFDCHIKVENSYFENINNPWQEQAIGALSSGGEIGWNNLDFISCIQPAYISNSYPVFTPPYSFTLDDINDVKSLVTDPIYGAGNRLRRLAAAHMPNGNIRSTMPPEIGTRHRVIVSTDIGGTDFDDFQSMVHLLLYADTLSIEGLISSPYGPGRKSDILSVIDYYESDYPKLKLYSILYPHPDYLRAITKQGAFDTPGPIGTSYPTEGSEWIVKCARRPDPRPLHILVWGGIEDLAQALHDAPDIVSKIRVYYIGGPNKKWSPDAFQYLFSNHKNLWIIEANSTYRGWFLGGNQSGKWENSTFVTQYITPCGALGKFFATKTGPTLKMGDSPSVGWLLRGNPEDPTSVGWGGQFVKAWARPHVVFSRLTTQSDKMEQFGILDLRLPFDPNTTNSPIAKMAIDNQVLKGYLLAPDTMQFLFCAKDAKENSYTIISNVPALNGRKGVITSYLPPASNKNKPATDLSNWWTDDPSTNLIESGNLGVKTLNPYREDFLGDFTKRLCRLD